MLKALLDRGRVVAERTQRFAKNYPKQTIFIAVWVVITMLPIVFLMQLLVRYSVNIPFWDQWMYVNLVDKWNHGTLGFYDLWVQHNEHRILVPKFVQLVMSSITGWNIRFEVVMNFAFALTTFGLMVALLRRTFSRATPILLIVPVVALLLFSPMQYINWIWGFQLAWFLSVTAVVACVWGLAKHTYKTIDRFFIFALVVGIVATYSMGNGMLIWAVGAGMLVLKAATKRHYVWWMVTAALAIAGYMFKLQRADQESPTFVLLHRTSDFVDYIFQYLGHNLAVTPQVAKNAGIILLVLMMVSVILLWRKRRLAIASPWLAIAGYGFLTAVLAAVSRMPNFGVSHSMVFSYTTMSVLFVIGALVTVCYAAFTYIYEASSQRLKQYLVVAFGLGILMWPAANGIWQNYTQGTRNLKELSNHLSTVRHCVFTATSADDDCLLKAYPDKEYAWQRIETLRKLHWDSLGR